MGRGDEVEVIDETLASYRRQGWLVDLTRLGQLIIQLNSVRCIEVDPHQVDVSDLLPVSPAPGGWEALSWFYE
ncbi:MAG TPA: hypothetical protein VNU19_11530 [Candidatus Acidoferrum sp.]|jgi:hypothetical protein|nr:hypothetical protein [Candidatus Acidoferrum sp.]